MTNNSSAALRCADTSFTSLSKPFLETFDLPKAHSVGHLCADSAAIDLARDAVPPAVGATARTPDAAILSGQSRRVLFRRARGHRGLRFVSASVARARGGCRRAGERFRLHSPST